MWPLQHVELVLGLVCLAAWPTAGAAAPGLAPAGEGLALAVLAQPGLGADDTPEERLERLKRLEEQGELVERDYLRRSAEQFGKGSIAELNQALARLNLTLAKLMIALGGLGLLYTWNKNKRKGHWAVLFTVFLLLLLGGVAASYFRWSPLV